MCMTWRMSEFEAKKIDLSHRAYGRASAFFVRVRVSVSLPLYFFLQDGIESKLGKSFGKDKCW